MSDSNDDSDRPDTPRTPPNTEPLRIVGAEEAGTLVGLDDLGDDRSGAPGGAERPAGGPRSPAPRPGRRPVFESVPDAVLDGDDLGPVTAGGSWFAASGPFDEEALAEYLTFQYTIGEKTLFKGIQGLLPGHVLTVDDGTVEMQVMASDPDELDAFLADILESSLGSLIKDSEVSIIPPLVGVRGFTIVR